MGKGLDTTRFSGMISEAITDSLQKQLNQAFDEELDRMFERVKQRKAEIIAAASIRISRMYDVQAMSDRIVITVREPET